MKQANWVTRSAFLIRRLAKCVVSFHKFHQMRRKCSATWYVVWIQLWRFGFFFFDITCHEFSAIKYVVWYLSLSANSLKWFLVLYRAILGRFYSFKRVHLSIRPNEFNCFNESFLMKSISGCSRTWCPHNDRCRTDIFPAGHLTDHIGNDA